MDENKNKIEAFVLRLAGHDNMPPVNITAMDALCVMLLQYNVRKRTSKNAKAGLLEMLGDATQPGIIKKMTFEVFETQDGPQISVTYTSTATSQDEADKQRQRFNEYISDAGIQALIHELVLRGPQRLAKIFGKQLAAPERTHKQSRTLMRDIARNVGKDTHQLSLFKKPLHDAVLELERQINDSPQGRPQKDVMSQKAALLALALVETFQTAPKDNNGFAVIKDVSGLADRIGTDGKYLKYLLLYLSGYQYAHTQLFADKIGVKMAQLFEIWMLYDANRAAYIPDLYKDTAGTMNLIVNEKIQELKVKPTAEFIADINNKKKSLGSIRVTDGWLATLDGLSVTAFKLANFSSTQIPEYSIYEDKLLDQLNLKKHAKVQGMPRVRKQLLEAMQELKVKGYFKQYQHDARPAGLLYSWQYTDKYIKHQEKYLKPETVEYIDYKDTSIPLEKRRQRYIEYVRSANKLSLEKAQKKAAEFIPE